MTWSSSRKRLAWIVVVVVLACLNVVQLLGLRPWAREQGVRFVYVDESGELREERTAQVGQCEFDVSLCAEEVPGIDGHPLADVRPYVKFVTRNRESGKARLPEVDPAAVEVVDSEGHRFRVVGVWLGESFRSVERLVYRYDLDAVEFNSHVRYQFPALWSGALNGEGWGPDERYTFRLRFPFKYGNEERVIEIARMVCHPVDPKWYHRYTTSLFRRSHGLTIDRRK